MQKPLFILERLDCVNLLQSLKKIVSFSVFLFVISVQIRLNCEKCRVNEKDICDFGMSEREAQLLVLV